MKMVNPQNLAQVELLMRNAIPLALVKANEIKHAKITLEAK